VNGTKIPPKQRFVKFTTVLLPFLCFAVERRVKNMFCLLLTRIQYYLEISAPQGKCPADGVDSSTSIADSGLNNLI
jgi:hypothetical protein